jgi:hypothetical protein
MNAPASIFSGVNVSTKRNYLLNLNYFSMDAKVETLAGIASRQVIRVTVPANVANDLNLFTSMLKDLGGRIGCKPCISGAACFFENERDFVVNPQGKILDIGH